MSLKHLKDSIRKHFKKDKDRGEDVISFLELKIWEIKNNKKLTKEQEKTYIAHKREKNGN